MEHVLSRTPDQVIALAVEYSILASTQLRSEAQNDRLAEILEAADQSDILDFWITEIDHYVAHCLGLLEEEYQQFYQDQQACLREYLGNPLAKNPQSIKSDRSL